MALKRAQHAKPRSCSNRRAKHAYNTTVRKPRHLHSESLRCRYHRYGKSSTEAVYAGLHSSNTTKPRDALEGSCLTARTSMTCSTRAPMEFLQSQHASAGVGSQSNRDDSRPIDVLTDALPTEAESQPDCDLSTQAHDYLVSDIQQMRAEERQTSTCANKQGPDLSSSHSFVVVCPWQQKLVMWCRCRCCLQCLLQIPTINNSRLISIWLLSGTTATRLEFQVVKRPGT